MGTKLGNGCTSGAACAAGGRAVHSRRTSASNVTAQREPRTPAVVCSMRRLRRCHNGIGVVEIAASPALRWSHA